MRILAGQLTVAKWDEKSFMEIAEPRKAHEAIVSYKVTGDLEGKLSGKYIMIYIDNDHATYTGCLHFKGQSGDFFIRETGAFEKGVATTRWEIIEGSATGEFAEIQGGGKYVAVGDKVNYELEVAGNKR